PMGSAHDVNFFLSLHDALPISRVLHQMGLEVMGIDITPELVGIARREYPDVTFIEGSMDTLPVPDGALGGILAWYSLIHTPPEEDRKSTRLNSSHVSISYAVFF